MIVSWQSMRHPRHLACRGSDNVCRRYLLSNGRRGVLRPICPNGRGVWWENTYLDGMGTGQHEEQSALDGRMF